MRRRRTNLAAFTLLELVLVLAVIAIVVGMVLPRMSFFGRGRRVGNAANQVVSLAGWAHTEAVSRGVSFRLNFDAAKRMYWLTMQNGTSFENMLQSQSATQTPTSYGNVREDWGQSFAAPDGVDFVCNMPPQPDGTYIEFRPSGRCDPGTVRFSDSGGQMMEVGCLSATEDFHVFSDDERQQEQALPQPPAPAQTR